MKTKIVIVGSGFTGCVLARLLKDRGHFVVIKEKASHLGGLCFSTKTSDGLIYEPYGGHIFHTKKDSVKDFVTRFADFNSYVHKKGIVIQGKLWPFPISMETIRKLPKSSQILKELDARPKELNKTNFETCMISLFGKTLYRLFIYNYTRKMWNKKPSSLSAEWAPKRIVLREKNTDLFLGEWQGAPVYGYTKMFEKMTSGIPVEFNREVLSFDFDKEFDLMIFTGRIDAYFKYCFGNLPYRSLEFSYPKNEKWENHSYGTINLPEHPKYVRKTNFGVIHQQKKDWIQFQKPIGVSRTNVPMYPVITTFSKARFNQYLRLCCKTSVVPAGRLGLFKYLNMDDAVALALEIVDIIELWNVKNHEKRYDMIQNIRR